VSAPQAKPCPFCGGSVALRSNLSGGYLVTCEELGCSFTQEIPLAQWNARPETRDISYDASFDRAALRAQTEHETANAIADWLTSCNMLNTAIKVRDGKYRETCTVEPQDDAQALAIGLARAARVMSGAEPLPPTPSRVPSASWACTACGGSGASGSGATIRACSGDCVRVSATDFVMLNTFADNPSVNRVHIHVTCSRCDFQHVVSNVNTEHVARAW
jgi:hypothetical protein